MNCSFAFPHALTLQSPALFAGYGAWLQACALGRGREALELWLGSAGRIEDGYLFAISHGHLLFCALRDLFPATSFFIMALLKWAFLVLHACAALAVPQNKDGSSTPTAIVKNGTLEGIHSSVYGQDYFLGVPFAQPPVGALRFRVPQSINTSWPETRSAKDYSASCVGYGSDQWPYASLSEDCLYLNVVRPAGYENEALPVAFWIHGGGLAQGSGIDQRYNLSFIVQRSVEIGKPIIGVSVNYRLHMWGFVTGEEVIQTGNANLGFRDQRLALHWVQENIAAFGGMISSPRY
jgi:hypothetical protein